MRLAGRWKAEKLEADGRRREVDGERLKVRTEVEGGFRIWEVECRRKEVDSGKPRGRGVKLKRLAAEGGKARG